MKASTATYKRMPIYLKALYTMRDAGDKNISSVGLAEAVYENPSVVKKDLSFALKRSGKPKVGYEIAAVINDIEEFLGYNRLKNAILVGVGKLGQALMGYGGFAKYGLNIIAGFDVDKKIIGKQIAGKMVYPIDYLEKYLEESNIKIGVLTTPQDSAQSVANILVDNGIVGIWNFSTAHLNLPETVAVKNEDMGASLAILSKKIEENLKK
ncbi:MAG TPA: redox-sensing transcriptional repressor Rex [Clostridia bacterium]|jgi:redox-sensing transcriptional repressor|nr:redox-sensing transcriptional repressor Rex [Clostridia bacterium]